MKKKKKEIYRRTVQLKMKGKTSGTRKGQRRGKEIERKKNGEKRGHTQLFVSLGLAHAMVNRHAYRKQKCLLQAVDAPGEGKTDLLKREKSEAL